MYKVVSECNKNEVWATGFYSKDKAQKSKDEKFSLKNNEEVK